MTDPGPLYDVAVVGAGPAGLAAAETAAAAGANVLLLDGSNQFGGQYWRHADERHSSDDPSRWHHSWTTYTTLAGKVRRHIDNRRIHFSGATSVISAERSDHFRLHTLAVPEAALPATRRSAVGVQRSRTVVLCPGAYDRQLPVPGWTTPGVMAAGGVQAFIKSQGVSPGQRVVLGGTGPFLISAAASVLEAGAEVVAVCEAASLSDWLRRGFSVTGVPSKGVEGAQYFASLMRNRVPYRQRTVITRIKGDERVQAVMTSRLDTRGFPVRGSEQCIDDIDLVGLGWGFVPQAELLLQLGAEVHTDVDGSVVGVVDRHQRSSCQGLYLAGEITGVAGAEAAMAEGRIAARAVAEGLGFRSIGHSFQALRDASLLRRHRSFARAMHTVHRIPAGWSQWLEQETVICRCEEITWEAVSRAMHSLSVRDPRGLKSVTRVGMGWCQGRMCGPAAMELCNAGTEAAVSTQRRSVALPVRVGDLAAWKPGG